MDTSSFVSASSSSGSGDGLQHSSSDESLPIRTYTTIRIFELSRLHTTIANLQAGARRRESVVRLYQQEIYCLRGKIRRLENQEKIGWCFAAAVLGLGLGFWVKIRMT